MVLLANFVERRISWGFFGFYGLHGFVCCGLKYFSGKMFAK
jgi:hypothetical protein